MDSDRRQPICSKHQKVSRTLNTPAYKIHVQFSACDQEDPEIFNYPFNFSILRVFYTTTHTQKDFRCAFEYLFRYLTQSPKIPDFREDFNRRLKFHLTHP